MTKKELLDALKDMPDDTEIRVPNESEFTAIGLAKDVIIECDGKNGCIPEVYIYS